MDEPCSALDPIATAHVEELIDELRSSFTIVIVTHNMQQAARVSQKTAFFHLGKLIEFGADRRDLHQSERADDPGLHHRPVRLRSVAWRHRASARNHIVTLLRRGSGRPDRQDRRRWAAWSSASSSRAIEALVERDVEAAERVVERRRPGRRASRRRSTSCAIRLLATRQPMAVDLRADRDGAQDLQRPRADRRLRHQHRQAHQAPHRRTSRSSRSSRSR